MNKTMTVRDVAGMIDHALLHPALTDAEVVRGCEVARRYGTATVCIKPCCISLAKDLLAGSSVGICPVIAFPHGNSMTSIKVMEARAAVLAGGTEIDMVINIGKALGGDWTYVSEEIKAVNDAVIGGGAILKVIFETDYLDDESIRRLCGICSDHAVAFVKTSTGYGFVKQDNGMFACRGATDHYLRLMRQHCPPSVRIKASGGLRTLDDVLRVRALGVARVGTSSTEAILEEARLRGMGGGAP